MMKKPLVSICIPTYNQGEFIEHTINSILNQSYTNLEIIVYDNCSTDNTEDIIKKIDSPKIKYIKNESNVGYVENCNRCLGASHGKYIALLHSDDIYESTFVEEEVRVMENDVAIGAVFCISNLIDRFGNLISKSNLPIESIENDLIKFDFNKLMIIIMEHDNFLVCPSAIVRKEVYHMVGFYKDIPIVQDLEMWLRISKIYDICVVNKRLINYRIHNNSGSQQFKNQLRTNIHELYPLLDVTLLNNNITIPQKTMKKYFLRKSGDYLLCSINSMLNKKYLLMTKNWLLSVYFRYRYISHIK
jgi:glycosyltransferase involved in cell wall biosynthesis